MCHLWLRILSGTVSPLTRLLGTLGWALRPGVWPACLKVQRVLPLQYLLPSLPPSLRHLFLSYVLFAWVVVTFSFWFLLVSLTTPGKRFCFIQVEPQGRGCVRNSPGGEVCWFPGCSLVPHTQDFLQFPPAASSFCFQDLVWTDTPFSCGLKLRH